MTKERTRENRQRNRQGLDTAKAHPIPVVCSALEDLDRLAKWEATGNDKARDLARRLRGFEFENRRFVSREPFEPPGLFQTPCLPGRYKLKESLYLLSGTWQNDGTGEPGKPGRKPLPDPEPPEENHPKLPENHFDVPDPSEYEDLLEAKKLLREEMGRIVRSHLPKEMIPKGSWPPKDPDMAKFLFHESFRRSLRPVFDQIGKRWYPDGLPLAWVIEALETTPVAKGLSALAVVVEEMKESTPTLGETGMLLTEGNKSPGILLSRFPGVVSLLEAPLQAIDHQEGELAASPSLHSPARRYQVDFPLQRELFPAPMTLEGYSTEGTWIGALSEIDLDQTLRGDICRLGLIAYALAVPAWITEEIGAIIVGGRDTYPNRRRFWLAHQFMRGLHVKVGRRGGRYDFFDAEGAGFQAKLGPPHWWVEKSGPMHFKLSAAITRLPGLKGDVRNSGIFRSVNGIEMAMLYGPTLGRKKSGRVSNHFRPVCPSGPGPEVFVENWQVLRFAGENVTRDSYRNCSGERQRYRRRVEALLAAGYFCEEDRPAAAGDTIEILRQIQGGRNHPGGLMVRASAQGCSLQQAGNREDRRVPGSHLLELLKI